MSKTIINSIILGDGYITKGGAICLHHSVVQYDYMYWKASLLESYGFNLTKDRCRLPSGYGTNNTIKICTSNTAIGKELRKLFYPNDSKLIPEGVIEEFNWPEFAILFMDDGRANKISHYNSLIKGVRVRKECTPYINRYSIAKPMLSDNDLNRFVNRLYTLGIDSTISKRRRIVISRAVSKIKFYEEIIPYMFVTMRYKIDIKPTLSYVIQ